MGLEQQLVMSEPGLISIDNDLAVSKRIYQSLGLMFRDDPDNLLACFTTFITIKYVSFTRLLAYICLHLVPSFVFSFGEKCILIYILHMPRPKPPFLYNLKN